MRTQDTQAEQEIRELHEEWFAASARKDLDATMSPIAPGIVSYEHSTPLEYTDIADIREECRQGFEYQGEDFSWTVPDLQILVREDLAVAWGLNRMASKDADGAGGLLVTRHPGVPSHEGRMENGAPTRFVPG